ncbi:MAG: pyridoxal-phosphate dependent enzyme, partial [Actinomycetota bacterium]|nr:pyridoxal-phosphate dependent enzyme [Actinomycetota bacterium]
VAVAGRVAGLRTDVYVPSTAPADKVRRIRDAGATLHLVDGDYEDAARAARTAAGRAGLPFVPAFDHPDVVCGQGTATLEVLADEPRCDAVYVAVGGGGLIAGTALAVDGRARVVGAEPSGIPTMAAALEAGFPVEVGVDSLTASALGARRTGELNLEIVTGRDVVVVAVEDEDILAARDLLWEEHRVAVEPAGAAALAGLRARWRAGQETAQLPCVVLCGANSGWHAE